MTPTLNTEIANKIELAPDSLLWVSPLAVARYDEYRDEEFLDVLGLSQFKPDLGEFWPTKGPCWDALAIVDSARGVVIVEAKSHLAELRARCSAKSEMSLMQINGAFQKTKRWAGVPEECEWLGNLYQMANRYAFLYFFLEVVKVPAWLVNVYFVGDSICPTSREQWERGIVVAKKQLGIIEVPNCVDIFLEAIP